MASAAPSVWAVQFGQSGQPRPDWLSRTAAPVRMISAEVTTPARAQRLSTAGDGASKSPATARRHEDRAGSPGPAARAGSSGSASAGTGPMVGGNAGGGARAYYGA